MAADEEPDGARPWPRFTGVRTFARLEHTGDPSGIDVAVLGIPFDTGTSFRPGARFGPEAVRAGSVLLRPYNRALGVDCLGSRRVADLGDLAVTPGNAARSLEQIADGLAPILEAGAIPISIGGDHTIVLGELRAQARAHGPVGVVLLDSHADTNDEYYGERYFHGTPFRRAVEEGVVDPSRSIFAGMRGPTYDVAELGGAEELGFEVIPGEELGALAPDAYGERVARRLGDGPAFLSFDIDFVDPAFAPGTGTPEVGGPTAAEALALVRSLAGIRFTGFDLVEVAPAYDGPGQITAMLAANVIFEFLGLIALGND